jgi:hypothetical protein
MIINIVCNQHKCLHRYPSITCGHPEPDIHNRGRNAICYSKEDCDKHIKPGPPKYAGCATCIDPTPDKCANACPYEDLEIEVKEFEDWIKTDESENIAKQDYYG